MTGYYLYFGSALNGLNSRIARHIRQDKKLHWHIDTLTAVAQVVQVWYVVDTRRWECAWAKAASCIPGVVMPARGFGSSDCRCPSHLLYLADWRDVSSAKTNLLAACPALVNWEYQDINAVGKLPA